MRPPRIVAFGPRRPWVGAGDEALVDVELSAGSESDVELTLRLLDVDREVARVSSRVHAHPGTGRHPLQVRLPGDSRHGYGLRVELRDRRSSQTTAPITATSAIEALEGWWQSPRHAAFTDFLEPAAAATAVAELARWHVTVVQHYDWMWRHYRYRPPDGAAEFVDALGRQVSHDAVRAAIEAGHDRGIASLAYGSVYGAEREYVDEHPDERTFDESGRALSLGDTFYITDLRPGSPWRDRLLSEYADAIGDFGFDGIHMDSYGEPHAAFGHDGQPIEFASLYPSLIADASERVHAVDPEARVVFNCVDGFPLEEVAAAPGACLYLELWPPDRSLADVVGWIERARRLAEGRAIVVAAYAAALGAARSSDDREAALEASLLLGSVITAAGAYHHSIAERDRVLIEGYYPAASPLRAAEARHWQALARFSARYVHLMSDPRSAPAETVGVAVFDGEGRPIRVSERPEPGAMWISMTRMPDGRRVLHVVDLHAQPDVYWDVPKVPALSRAGLSLRWPGARRPRAASPWSVHGDAVSLRPSGPPTNEAWALPRFRRWLMVVEAAG